MYEVNGVEISGYLKAIEAAKAVGGEVFEIREDGSKIRRWAPAAAVSAKQVRRYNEQKSAFEAQKRLNAKC